MARAKKTEAPASNIRHPRETSSLIGQADAEKQFLQAYASGKLPHAWLISGPKGIGKATFAYAIAKFLLSGGKPGATSLECDAELPSVRRAMAGSHSDLMVLENNTGSEIIAEQSREVANFLSLTPAESNWRVVIVDAADSMNRHAANALLKTLEEPPTRAILLLVSHSPGNLLPTIRSRCRSLKLPALARPDFSALVREHAPETEPAIQLAYYDLAGGSPGVALFLLDQEAIALYTALLELFPLSSSRADWVATYGLAEQMSAKVDANRFEACQYVLQYLFRRIVMVAEMGASAVAELLEGEAEILAHIASFKRADEWLALWEETAQILQDVRRIHLDRKSVLINIIAAMQGKNASAA